MCTFWGWRDGTEVKALAALAENLGSVPSTHTHGSSKQPAALAPGALGASSDLLGQCMQVVYQHTCRKTLTQKNILINKIKVHVKQEYHTWHIINQTFISVYL